MRSWLYALAVIGCGLRGLHEMRKMKAKRPQVATVGTILAYAFIAFGIYGLLMAASNVDR